MTAFHCIRIGKEFPMHIGVPKEIKNHEYRVGLTPRRGARAGAPRPSGQRADAAPVPASAATDADYQAAGAQVLPDAAAVFAAAEMVVKVKEPQPQECAMLREGQILFTYLHLAPDPVQADGLLKSGCTAIAYETITDARGGLPLLAPMSEVAGRMAIQVGAVALQKANGTTSGGLGCCSAACPACRRRAWW
jgi:alanine dehydrogenase